MLFITPRVVENEVDVRAAIDDLRRKMENMDAFIPLIRPIIGPVFPGAAVNPSLAPFYDAGLRRNPPPPPHSAADVACAGPAATAAGKHVVLRVSLFARLATPREAPAGASH